MFVRKCQCVCLCFKLRCVIQRFIAAYHRSYLLTLATESWTTTVLLITWVSSCLISSCYTFWWDLRMDWGLMETNKAGDENRFLREEIVYSSPFFYYFGIIEDFVLRFAWTFTVSVTHDKVLKSQVNVDACGCDLYTRTCVLASSMCLHLDFDSVIA